MVHEHNHNTEAIGDKRLMVAIGVNTALTLGQIDNNSHLYRLARKQLPNH